MRSQNQMKMLKAQFLYLIGNSKIHSKFLFFLALFVCLTFQNSWSQKVSETGLPFIQNYAPDEYGAFDQNWGAVQDSAGIIYFANGDGVLSYDGVTWNLIELPNKGSVFALTITDKDEIYVGAGNELGYLKSNSKGELNYLSLLSKLPKEYHDFGQIRSIISHNNMVFFGSKKYIFKWDGSNFKTWKNSGDSFLYFVHDKVLKRRKQGLMEFKDNKFELVPNGEFFADKKIYSILPFDETTYLLATRDQIYLYDGETIIDFKTDFFDFLVDNPIYNGTKLNDGSLAIGSLRKGILVFDNEGQTKHLLNKESSIRSNGVLGLFQDRSGVLWASLFSGITKIEIGSPFSFYNETNNAPDQVYDFQRFNRKLYVGGPQGFFVLNSEKTKGNNVLDIVPGDFGMVWDMLLFQDKMLVGTGSGVYEIDKNDGSKKILSEQVGLFYHSKLNPNRVYIGNDSGLLAMYYENEKWTLEKIFEQIDYTVAYIVETKKGDLWLGLDSNKVAKLSFKSHRRNRSDNPIIEIFSPENGLPDDIGKLYMVKDELYFSSDNKVFSYSKETNRFTEDKKLFPSLGLGDKNVKINTVDENGIWLIELLGEERIDQLLVVPQKDGTIELNKFEEGRIMNLRGNGLFAELKDSVIWYKGKPGIVRHDLTKETTIKALNSNARISKVLSNSDSLLFSGYESSLIPQLSFKNNQLRFQYANPSFYDESKNQFQYILEGFDENWSTWSYETKKDYTNLLGGDYTFKVRSKNIFNNISDEDSYSFSILSPWYRTWWAYLLYGLGTIAIVSLLLQWRSKELKRKNENLENLITKRTTEIRHKNELLNHQTEQLEQLNDSKTKLYSNITHDFRTPLTVILGMADTLKTNVLNKSYEGADTSLEMIRRNGKNLLHLVNEMLDLAKVESGSMELNLVQTDAIPFVKYLSESFHSLAEAKKINLTVYSEIDALEMDIDVNKMASIISNLLSNAVKFTSTNGKIIVHLNKTEDGKLFLIKVQDNGRGLTAEDMAHLFDRFYQVDDDSANRQQGTGIGLSLAKEFVELMNGTIAVESTLGKGSTFKVQLPITNTAVKTEDAKTTIEQPIKTVPSIVTKEALFTDDYSELPLVLLIEDNLDVAHYLETCLKGKYQTIHASDGNTGLEMAFENFPDIIISDVMMPGKDGLEVCATLKADERTDHIPVILLTAKVTTEDRLTGLTHGADAYLAKPFNKEELFTRLDQLILVRKKLIGKLEKNGLSFLLKEKVENPQTKFLKQVIECIHAHLDDANFGPTQLAKEMRFSESQIYRKLKSITDKSTAIFMRSVRLQKAKELIETTDKTISEIAYQVGFNDPSWFSRAFKKEFNIAPSDIHK